MTEKHFRTSRTRVRTPAPECKDGRTHQEFLESTDINRIIGRFSRTGLPPEPEQQYADVTGLQAGDLTQRINSSREILDKAGKFVSDREAQAVADEKQRQLDIEEELTRLRAENAALKGPQPD